MSVASLADVLPSSALASEESTGPVDRLVPPPDAVVRPESTEEVAATLRWASANGYGVLPAASGRRWRITAPDRPFVVLRTDRLNGIDIYESADLTFTARAGTPMAVLSERLGAHGQWLPFDPPRVSDRSLGGFIAVGESGPVWMGYGELRNHVLGVTVVTGDGRVLKLGGRVVKNVAGFDLLKPLVGSRGRLGVITSACVRAFPRPEEDALLVLTGDGPLQLAGAAQAIGTAPLLPVSSLLVAPAPRPIASRAALFVRLHGSRATVAADHRTLERHVGVRFDRVDAASEMMAEARDLVEGGVVFTANALPSRLAEVIEAVEATLGRGSAWSGEDSAMAADPYQGRVRFTAGAVGPDATARLRDAVERLGGVLSVHGSAGQSRADQLDFVTRVATLARAASTPRPHEAELVAGLERVFDPRGVFWPCRT